MGFKKKGGKGRDASRPFIRPKAKPRKINQKRMTPFKRKINGSSTRGTWKGLKQRTRCYKCGELGHHGKECRIKDAATAAAHKAAIMKKEPPRNKKVIHFALSNPYCDNGFAEDCITYDFEKVHELSSYLVACASIVVNMARIAVGGCFIGLT